MTAKISRHHEMEGNTKFCTKRPVLINAHPCKAIGLIVFRSQRNVQNKCITIFTFVFVLPWFALTSPCNYRSKEGCCICGAKSQKGSPFRQTEKIECYLASVFGLAGRNGDICNAYFSRVSRWRRNNTGQSNLTNLPPGHQVSRRLLTFHKLYISYHVMFSSSSKTE